MVTDRDVARVFPGCPPKGGHAGFGFANETVVKLPFKRYYDNTSSRSWV
jgi:hypothetical protein